MESITLTEKLAENRRKRKPCPQATGRLQPLRLFSTLLAFTLTEGSERKQCLRQLSRRQLSQLNRSPLIRSKIDRILSWERPDATMATGQEREESYISQEGVSWPTTTPREPERAEAVESQPWHTTSRKGTRPLAELRPT